ncbi:MAG: hypothetical protein ACJAZ8_002057 [Planctomycetota bacterium]|jgi:hypothetical protein
MIKFNTLALALTCVLALPSCLLIAGGAAGYVVSQEVLPGNVHTSIVLFDVDTTWASAQETMLSKAEDGIETTDYPRRIEAEVAGANVEVNVEAYDMNRSLIRVKASRFLSADNDVAKMVLNKIVDDLGQRR